MLPTGVWVFLGTAAFIGLFGLVLLAWALFSDRSRGRRRCPKCWYAMDAAPADSARRCPECGHVAKSEKRLYRTRRRWKAASAAAAAFVVAIVLAFTPMALIRGPGAVLPATVLILLLELDDAEWIRDGIDRRLEYTFLFAERQERGGLWAWQWRWLGRVTLKRMDDSHSSQDWLARAGYLNWLADARDHSRNPVLRERIAHRLIEEVDSDDVRLRALASRLAVDPAHLDESLARTLAFLEQHNDRNSRYQALNGLAMIARVRADAAEHLMQWMMHEDADARRLAVGAVRTAAPEMARHEHLPGVYEIVLALTEDEDDAVRRESIMTLAHLQDDDDAWRTIEAAWNGDDAAARAGAFSAAWRRRDQRLDIFARMAVEALDLEDWNQQDRWWASHSLREIPVQYILPHAARIEALAEDNDQRVRFLVEPVIRRLQRARR